MTKVDQRLVDAFEAAVVAVALAHHEFTSAQVWRLVPESLHPPQVDPGRGGICQGAAAALWQMVDGRHCTRAGVRASGRPTGHAGPTTLYRSLIHGRPDLVTGIDVQLSIFDVPGDGE